MQAYQLAMNNVYWSRWQNWACYYRSDNSCDRLDEVAPDNDEQNPWYTFEDRSGTSFTEHGLPSGTSAAGIGDKATLSISTKLQDAPRSGLALPKRVFARGDYPTLRDGFPAASYSRFETSGRATHVGKWEVAGRDCSYTDEQAQAAAETFVAHEIPTLVGRIKWHPPSRIRWGRHRASEPLVLHTGGYSLTGVLTHRDVPILGDAINVTILGDTVEFVSLTCHVVVGVSDDLGTVISCASALENARPQLEKVLGNSREFEVVDARLAYLGLPFLRPGEMKEEILEYRAVWEVVLTVMPMANSRAGTAALYLDAFTGHYLGQLPR